MSWTAAIDLGSASTQLLLTDGITRISRTVDTMMGGTALSHAGEIRPAVIGSEALDRVASALGEFAGLIETHGTTRVRVLGTAAARHAANTDDLAEVVTTIFGTGTELEVLDAVTEARLSFLGAVSDRELLGGGTGPVVTLDIGGGSTELALGSPADRAGQALTWSMPIGGSTLTDAYLASDPPQPEELSAALSVVELHLDDIRREAPELAGAIAGDSRGEATVLGLGVVATVAAIEVGHDGPVHGFVLSRAATEDVFRTIATETSTDRAHNPGLPPTRVDAIVGACALLVETMRQFGLEQVVVSQRGLLDGATRELADHLG